MIDYSSMKNNKNLNQNMNLASPQSNISIANEINFTRQNNPNDGYLGG